MVVYRAELYFLSKAGQCLDEVPTKLLNSGVSEKVDAITNINAAAVACVDSKYSRC